MLLGLTSSRYPELARTKLEKNAQKKLVSLSLSLGERSMSEGCNLSSAVYGRERVGRAGVMMGVGYEGGV